MTRRRVAEDPRQLAMEPLYFQVPPAPKSDAGSLDIGAAVRETLSDELGAVKSASAGQVDRFEVAARISRLTGRDISKNMIDRYSALSAEEWRFPLELLPAFVQATGSYKLLELLAEACGCKILRGQEAWLAEVGTLIVKKREIERRLADFARSGKSDVVNAMMDKARRRTGSDGE